MLGLGSSIMKGGIDPLTLWGTYTSDFSSGVDSWQASSVESSSSDLTLSSATGPDGESGWLKGVYSANQTDALSGIVYIGLWSGNISGNNMSDAKRIEISAKIYLENDWDGSDAVTTFFHPGASANASQSVNYNTEVAQDTITTISGTVDVSDSSNSNATAFITWRAANDAPQNGAIFWFKTIVFKIYG